MVSYFSCLRTSVMELQRRVSVSANEYEESEGMQRSEAIKTEDIYQCLNQPPTAAPQYNTHTALISEQRWQKLVVLLFAVNILILMIILAITGMNYSINKEAHLRQVANGQRANDQEGWQLHDNVFYLFWRDQSDCGAAIRFCEQRNASLVNITWKNKVWLQSRVNGKQFWVSGSLDGSGDSANKLMDGDLEDNEDNQCGILTHGINKEHTEGFVCEREAKINIISAF
ncbi:uncharacterized protein [Paramisgurnus dabryanus]|uniref:uncharacterized protein isoform X1 n=1 Tax=Paramisgurnus dabryanus TaxID=90735 RepID=UPI0031F364EB